MFLGFCSWLFEGVGRQKAEELLSLPGNRVGSFMVRESSRERGEYQEAASASPPWARLHKIQKRAASLNAQNFKGSLSHMTKYAFEIWTRQTDKVRGS